jgi:hypothetical protein
MPINLNLPALGDPLALDYYSVLRPFRDLLAAVHHVNTTHGTDCGCGLCCVTEHMEWALVVFEREVADQAPCEVHNLLPGHAQDEAAGRAAGWKGDEDEGRPE